MAKKSASPEALPLLDDFLLSLQSNNYSPETVYNYERDLKVFENFLTESKFGFKELTRRSLDYYKAYLNSIDRRTAEQAKGEKRLKSYSINRCLSALRAYLRYLVEMDYQTPILAEQVKLVKTERKHPKVGEFDEIVNLIESPDELERNHFVATRNRAMLEILFSTGMRISELINLKRRQIDQTGKIFIMGKGKKERFVYLTPRATHHLKNYLTLRQSDSDYLFIPLRGANANEKNKKISTNYLQERIKYYRQAKDITVPLSAHSLRHGFATYLAESGANPAAIQILLGHESLETTTRYVHASDKYAEETHKKFHPLKND